MTSHEYENDQELAEDAVDAEALSRVEGFILEIANRNHPESLSQPAAAESYGRLSVGTLSCRASF